MNKLLFFTLSLIVSLNLSAGQSTGNGGDVVVCNEAESDETIELLDLYEAREVHGLVVDHDSDSMDATSSALFQLGKVSNWYMHKNYTQRISSFFSRVNFVDKELIDIPDSFHIFIPTNCNIKQIAINYRNGIIEIDKVLWSKLNHLQQGALILHELFYEDLILTGFNNSILARQLNGYLHGNKFKNHQSSDRPTVIDELISNNLNSISFSDTAEVKKIYLQTPFGAKIKNYFLLKLLRGFETESIFTDNFVETVVASLQRLEGEDEREVIVGFISALKKPNVFWKQALIPVKKYYLSKIAEVIANKMPEDYMKFLYHNISANTIELFLLNLLSQFKLDQKDQAIIADSYSLFLDRCNGPEGSWYSCQNIQKKLFNPLVLQFETFDDFTDKLVFASLESKCCRPEIDFIVRYLKLSTVDLNLLELIYSNYVLPKLDYNIFYPDLRPLIEIFMENNFKMAEITQELEKILLNTKKAYLGISFIYEHDKDDKLYNKYSNLIEKHFLSSKLEQNDFLVFLELYSNRNIPKKLIDNFILRMRNDEISDYLILRILEIFILDNNKNESTCNYLGYLLRYKQGSFNSYDLDILRLLQRLNFTSAFLDSVYVQELKINLNSKYKLKSLLNCLLEKKISKEVLEVVSFIAKTASDIENKNLSQKILDYNGF